MENVPKPQFAQSCIERVKQETLTEHEESQVKKGSFRGHTASITKPVTDEGAIAQACVESPGREGGLDIGGIVKLITHARAKKSSAQQGVKWRAGIVTNLGAGDGKLFVEQYCDPGGIDIEKTTATVSDANSFENKLIDYEKQIECDLNKVKKSKRKILFPVMEQKVCSYLRSGRFRENELLKDDSTSVGRLVFSDKNFLKIKESAIDCVMDYFDDLCYQCLSWKADFLISNVHELVSLLMTVKHMVDSCSSVFRVFLSRFYHFILRVPENVFHVFLMDFGSVDKDKPYLNDWVYLLYDLDRFENHERKDRILHEMISACQSNESLRDFLRKYQMKKINETAIFSLAGEYDRALKENNGSAFLCLSIRLLGFYSGLPSYPTMGLAALKYVYKNKHVPIVAGPLESFIELHDNLSGSENVAIHQLLLFIRDDHCPDNKKLPADLYYYLQSLVFYLSGDYEKAIDNARRCHYAEACWLIGFIKKEQGDYKMATEYFERTSSMGLSIGHYDLGEVYHLSGKEDECVLNELEAAKKYLNYLGFKDVGALEPLLEELKDRQPQGAEVKLNPLDDIEVLATAIEGELKTKPGKKKKKKRKSQKESELATVMTEQSFDDVNTMVKKESQDSVGQVQGGARRKTSGGYVRFGADSEMSSQSKKRKVRSYKLRIEQMLWRREYLEIQKLLVESYHYFRDDIMSRFALVQSGLWMLRKLANDTLYLNVMLSKGVQGIDIGWASPDGDKAYQEEYVAIKDRLSNITCHEPTSSPSDDIRNGNCDLGILWLAFFFSNESRHWREDPVGTVNAVKAFVHDVKTLFLGASYLSCISHTTCDYKDQTLHRRDFYDAADLMNEFRLLIKAGGKLPARIEKKTPFGKLFK